LRGWSHGISCLIALPLGLALTLAADGRELVAAIVYGATSPSCSGRAACTTS
jgi:hypothetical protein